MQSEISRWCLLFHKYVYWSEDTSSKLSIVEWLKMEIIESIIMTFQWKLTGGGGEGPKREKLFMTMVTAYNLYNTTASLNITIPISFQSTSHLQAQYARPLCPILTPSVGIKGAYQACRGLWFILHILTFAWSWGRRLTEEHSKCCQSNILMKAHSTGRN